MKRFILPLFLLISSSTFAAIDTGDGSDGLCPGLAGAIDTDVKAIYNCTDFTTSGAITVTGSLPLTIKVQGDVTISHSITVTPGNASGAVDNTDIIVAGAQGNDGADASCTNFGSIFEVGGGGGSGGSHSSSGLAGADGMRGSSDPGHDVGPGAIAPTTTYSNVLNFPSGMTGGSAGGSGGAGCTELGGPVAGIAGGAGGGVVHIASGGDILISANINTDGESVAGGASYGGSGGSGAGGTIFIQAAFNITNDATLSALGGITTGSSNVNSGDGGNGGNGVIRLDDIDGVIDGSGSASPSATIISTSAVGLETLSSGIEPGCAVREDMTPKNNNILGAILLMIILVGLNWKELQKARH